MSNILETRSIQRAILKLLISEHYILRTNISKIDIRWFNSQERRFIFQQISDKFQDSKSQLTHTLYEFEINSKIKETEREGYRTEWNLILGEEVGETADALIEQLSRSATAREILDIIGKTTELIETGDIEKATNSLKSKVISMGTKYEERPTINIYDYEHRLKVLRDKQTNPEKFKGLQTGFREFDRRTGGLFPSELTLISALSGVGKSTFLKQLGVNAIRNGKNVLHVTNEENEFQVQLKYDALITEIDYFKFKNAEFDGTLGEQQIDHWIKKMKELKDPKFGKLFIKEIPMYSNVIEIEKVFFELEQQGIKLDLIIIDYLDHLAPIHHAFSENDEPAKTVADCKGLSILLRIPVITATQSATGAEKKQDRGDSFGKMDVYGSKRKVHSANTLMYIIQERQDQSQLKSNGGDRDFIYECDWIWVIQISKNRDGACFTFKCQQFVKTGRVEELKKPLRSGLLDDDKEKKDEIILENIEQEVDDQAKIDVGKSKEVIRRAARA